MVESLGTVQEKSIDIVDALVQSLQRDVGYVREKAAESLRHIAIDSYSLFPKEEDSGILQKVHLLLKNFQVHQLYEESFAS